MLYLLVCTLAPVNARERLVEAAQDLLWERGYVGTSPRAIQDRAGAGQGSMYHHFTGKADLARTALQRTADRERAGAEALLSGDGTALERLTGYLRRERQVLRGCPVGRHAQDPDLVADPELRAPLETTFAWLRARLAEVVAEGQEAGELRADVDPAAVAAALVATVQGGYVLARAAGRPEPFEEATEGAVALLAALAR
ncbi:transcriptional regulator, TetR family [Geodermatophilus amargosae]|uniref:Transcriptional regulator, TetR family n=1 Tax=Geodermatophilus amargosae TaxID=1296565 RepID=A0A1I7B9N2_9ACTN|nr:transcriptional regulator, TetR family [Geodermatophilus amargosae]